MSERREVQAVDRGRAVALVVVGPAAWAVAVLVCLAIQLIVCASGTDAAATGVRWSIAVLGAIAVAVSLVALGASWRRGTHDGPTSIGIAVSAGAAVGATALVLVAIIVPSASVC
jgi:hypothetical protein